MSSLPFTSPRWSVSGSTRRSQLRRGLRAAPWFAAAVAMVAAQACSKDAASPTQGESASAAVDHVGEARLALAEDRFDDARRHLDAAPAGPAVAELRGRVDAVAEVMTAAAAREARLIVDRAERRSTQADGGPSLLFYLDLLDGDGGLIPPGEVVDVRLRVEGAPRVGAWQVPVEGISRPVSVSILFANHRSYSFVEGAAGEKSEVVEAQLAGYRDLLGSLAQGSDWSSVWFYDNEAVNRISAWSQDHAGAARRLVGLIRPASEDSFPAPMLYAHIERVTRDILDSGSQLSSRRLLVLMSDGKDRFIDRKAVFDNRVTNIVDTASEAGVRIVALGMTLDVPEPLDPLRDLAERTGGMYLAVGHETPDSIRHAIRDAGERIKGQLVLAFTPESFEGLSPPVDVELEVVTRRGVAKATARVAP